MCPFKAHLLACGLVYSYRKENRVMVIMSKLRKEKKKRSMVTKDMI